MIRIMALTKEFDICDINNLKDLSDGSFQWYWVDYTTPTEEEAETLDKYFKFHPLAIEDCLHLLQRPKLDHYDDVHFFVLHALRQVNLTADEVDLFIGKNFLITFHHKQQQEIDEAWNKIKEQNNLRQKGHLYAMYVVVDKLVDNYFPSVYQIEDQLLEVETNDNNKNIQQLMNQVFEIRSRLLKLRKTIIPMRDLLYRTLNSDRIEGLKAQHVYFV